MAVTGIRTPAPGSPTQCFNQLSYLPPLSNQAGAGGTGARGTGGRGNWPGISRRGLKGVRS